MDVQRWMERGSSVGGSQVEALETIAEHGGH
jgi:hypothetical protein